MRRSRFLVATIAVSVAFLAGACRKGSSADVGSACIADSIGTLHHMPIPSCRDDAWICRAKCGVGDAAACLSLAYQAEEANKQDEAVRLYRQACLGGEANACTNYAAHIWSGKHTKNELNCAGKIFEKSCAAKEPFACGMVGRLMIEDATPPAYSEGRRYLEAACEQVGGFPCRVLAKHLESGKLGEYEPGKIRALLKKACDDGDPDACGNPATAAETFH